MGTERHNDEILHAQKNEFVDNNKTTNPRNLQVTRI